MKPQLSSILRRTFALFLFLAATSAIPARAAIPACSATPTNNIPTGPTIYVASSAGSTTPGVVFVIDATTNTVACSIAVGTTPVHLAVSPDSSLLFVENDTDGTVTVANLADGTTTTVTLPGITAPMTANLAVSPDNSRVYVVSLPATLTASTQASLSVISLPALTVSAPISVVASPPTPVTAPGLGVAFTPDATNAFIATENLTYIVSTSNDSVSTTIPVNGGTTAIDQNGNFAYVVDVASSASTTVSQIAISTNAILAPANITPICTQGNTVAVPPPPNGTLAYYSCPGNGTSNFIQAIDFTSATPSAAVGNVTVSPTAHPQGLAVTSDGNEAYVALDDGTLAIVNTSFPGSPNTLSSTTITAGGSPAWILQRPVKLPSLTPTTASVVSGATQQFSSSVLYAFSTGNTLIWAVNGVVGGNSTVGTISTSGLYTAPSTIPTPAQVTVSATSSEVPTVSKFYPLKATVTITPSQLVFTSSPVTITAGVCSTGITVQSQDSSNNPANPSSIETLALASGSTGGTFYSDNACAAAISSTTIPTTANSATFFYKDTKAGAPAITVTGSGSFTATMTQNETVNAGPASTLTVAGYPSSYTPGTANNFTVTAKDTFGNTAAGYTGTVHFTSSDTQAVLPANYTFVAADSGMHTFSATLKTAGTQSITATDNVTASISGTQAGITSGTITASTLIVAGFASTVTAGSSNSFTVTAQDGLGNTATGYAGTVHFTSSDPQAVLPANYTFVAGDSGAHMFSATLKTSGTQSITATDTVTASIAGTQSTITVNPGPATTIIVAGFASPVTAGTASNFTVTAKDTFTNTATGYTGTVHFTSSDPQAVLPANYTFVTADSGMHTFSATLKTATTGVGTQSITATDTVTASITGTQAGITVNPAAASKLVFTSQPASGALGGNQKPLNPPPSPPGPGPVAVSVEDTFGNVVTADTSNVSMTISIGGAFSAGSTTTVAASGGVATFSNLAPTIAGTFTLSASDGSLAGATSNTFTLTSTITVNVTSALGTTMNTVKIEDLPAGTDTFAAVATNDPNVPSLAVTWKLFSCGGVITNTNGLTPCGSVASNGAYTPPQIVPPANSFVAQATAVADPSKTANTGTITINSTVTVAVAPLNPTLGINNTQTKITATVQSDPNSLGVTFSLGACPVAPTTNPANPNPCGTLTPIDNFNVTYNAPPVVQPNAPQVTIIAKSIADASKTGTSAITINSSVTVSVSIVAASVPAPATGTVALGFSVSFAAAVTGDSSSFGVKNWAVNGVIGGNSTVGMIVATDATHATYIAPAAVPSPATVNVTATSVADFNKTSPSSTVQVVSDQLVYDSAALSGQMITVPSNVSSATIVIDLQGPANTPASAFACTSLDTLTAKATCSFAINQPPPASIACQSRCTSATLTLTVVRTSATLFDPVSKGPGDRLLRMAALALLLPAVVFVLVLFHRPSFGTQRIKHALAFALLLCLTLGWMSACNQFATPATPPSPVPPTGAGTRGTLTVTATPAGGGAFSQVTISVPFLVQ